MTISSSNGYLVTLLRLQQASTGLTLGLSQGQPVPYVDGLVPIGVSLGGSKQIAQPGNICLVEVNSSAGAVVLDVPLVLPIIGTLPYPLEAGKLSPASDVTGGLPIIYAVALEPLSAGGGRVRALLVGIVPIPIAAPPPPIPFPFPPQANGLVFGVDDETSVLTTPVPAGKIRVFSMGVANLIGEGTVEWTLELIAADAQTYTLFDQMAAESFTPPACVAGEVLRLTVTTPNTSIRVYLPYMDIDLVNQADNPVVLATRLRLTDAEPAVTIANNVAATAMRAWNDKTDFMSLTNNLSGVYAEYGFLGLVIYNPDVVNHPINVTHHGDTDVVTNSVTATAGFSIFANPNAGGPINFGESIEITKSDANQVTNLFVAAIWARYPLAP